MTTAVLCGPEHRDEWNDFAAFVPGGDVLQSYEWGELKGRGEWTPIRLAMKEGGRIVSGMSLLKRPLPLPGKSILYASRGPLLRDWTAPRLGELIGAARKTAREHGAILIKVDPALSDESTAGLLREEGFVPVGGKDGFGGTQPRCVMVLDLHPTEEELLAGFKPKWRYNIRLAERKGIVVESHCDKDRLPEFYDLLTVTAQRDGFLVRSFDYFSAMWDLLVPNGMGKLFLARYEDEPVAGAFCTLFGPVCCYTYGASANRHREKMPNHLVQWTMIRWARDHGYTVYDFRGVSPRRADPSDDKLAGLNRFKEGFGAEFVEYIGEYDLPLSPLWYPLWTRAMPMARNLFKRTRRHVTPANESSESDVRAPGGGGV